MSVEHPRKFLQRASLVSRYRDIEFYVYYLTAATGPLWTLAALRPETYSGRRVCTRACEGGLPMAHDAPSASAARVSSSQVIGSPRRPSNYCRRR